MKIKAISRSEEAETRSSTAEAIKVHKNPDPKLHPFEKAREVRARGGVARGLSGARHD
jgi:WD repeat and SOF domain-containing protein 1